MSKEKVDIKSAHEYALYLNKIFAGRRDAKMLKLLCMQSFYDGLAFRDGKLIVEIKEKR